MATLPRNAFLRGLSPAAFALIVPNLEAVHLALGEGVCAAGTPADWVYFPETCVLSALLTDSEGRTIEAQMVGAEGAYGLSEACSRGKFNLDTFVQIDGRVWRAPGALLRRLVQDNTEFSVRAWTLADYQMSESRQTALCNAMHLVERRFPRWLVETYQRSSGRNPLPLRQEFIAAMLGVQRTTVTLFAQRLQETGLIEYRRGQIRLNDIEGLTHRACECHSVAVSRRLEVQLQPLPWD